MNKKEFLAYLRKGLSELPQDDAEERLNFYREMLEDRIEEGLSEEEAVAAAGPIEEIVARERAEAPPAEGQARKGRLSAREILLLSLGAPLWVPLGIAAAAVIFSLYASAWVVVASFWACFASFGAAALVGLILPPLQGSLIAALLMLGAALFSAGLSILTFFGCLAATKGMLSLTVLLATWAKRLFRGREKA